MLSGWVSRAPRIHPWKGREIFRDTESISMKVESRLSWKVESRSWWEKIEKQREVGRGLCEELERGESRSATLSRNFV